VIDYFWIKVVTTLANEVFDLANDIEGGSIGTDSCCSRVQKYFCDEKDSEVGTAFDCGLAQGAYCSRTCFGNVSISSVAESIVLRAVAIVAAIVGIRACQQMYKEDPGTEGGGAGEGELATYIHMRTKGAVVCCL